MGAPDMGVLSGAGRNKPLKIHSSSRQIGPIWLRIHEGAPAMPVSHARGAHRHCSGGGCLPVTHS